ncbi:uncharacterized protein LOC128236534 [Mya arenaria]|uniref:uncharacterized protein LOC128236534 n=1 Tax=Mya arenaria TaxID=6604 RepID=UPI0022DF26B8|nr:uncharacterized protein LOC128236534 [Mya arenaria]XP_052807410.1 uncharacterized protein LOC128236534 [Mya arenaria]
MVKRKSINGTSEAEPSSKKSKQTTKAGASSKTSKSCTLEKAPKASTKADKKQSYPKLVDEDDNFETEKLEFTEPAPMLNSRGQLVFQTHPEFRPNLTPKEVLHMGSFGGTYYRPIYSSITKKNYSGAWKELPKDWLEGLSLSKQVSNPKYDVGVNRYGVKCGGSLEMWEESGWMHKQDPYGWFQWYCRYYQGRRTSDDDRQIGRWLRCAGDTGRWRGNLISKCYKSGKAFDNRVVSPVVRQTLQHWAYQLNKEDFEAGVKRMKAKGSL